MHFIFSRKGEYRMIRFVVYFGCLLLLGISEEIKANTLLWMSLSFLFMTLSISQLMMHGEEEWTEED